ncbi:hypothetical protein ABZX62_34545 [Streptomyces flavidovirens]|uniref:Uncharacterized protein n=1 Tax=Streptomyces flavidovirens TaxID=67298 RepID=A0ABW6RS87_9ACTN
MREIGDSITEGPGLRWAFMGPGVDPAPSPSPPAAPEATPVATTELLAVHVDQKAGRAAPFPDAIRKRLRTLAEEHPV